MFVLFQFVSFIVNILYNLTFHCVLCLLSPEALCAISILCWMIWFFVFLIVISSLRSLYLNIEEQCLFIWFFCLNLCKSSLSFAKCLLEASIWIIADKWAQFRASVGFLDLSCRCSSGWLETNFQLFQNLLLIIVNEYIHWQWCKPDKKAVMSLFINTKHIGRYDRGIWHWQW